MNRNMRKQGRNRQGSGLATSIKKAEASGRGTAAAAVRSAVRPDAAAVRLPVEMNEVVEADVVGLGHEGEGVGRYGGFTLFIPGALPGERVRARVTEVKKQFGRAELLQVLTASADRIAPPCRIYEQCGGCQLQHMAYPAQLKWKRRIVTDALTRIGKLAVAEPGDIGGIEGSDGNGGDGNGGDGNGAALAGADAGAGSRGGKPGGIVVHPVIGMDEPWRYRNKAQVPIGWDLGEGGLVGGFYALGTHTIVDMDACLIQHERNDNVVAATKRIARELGIEAYDEKSHTGWLRHIVAKTAFATGEIMVVLVATGPVVPVGEQLVERIREELPDVASIILNVNPERTRLVFGDLTLTLWGSDSITDAIGGVRFAISARSFYQVNPVQTEVLYGTALDYADLSGEETVIDAYCGIGTISLFLAGKARHVYGVEIVPDAVEDARANARLNGIANVEFAVGRAEAVIPAWRAEGIDADVIVVDPPRKGCDAALLDTIIAMRPKRVVYVSCNPSTLARDLRILEDGGFRTVEVQPVDMFPHTGHVECVSQIVLKEEAGSR